MVSGFVKASSHNLKYCGIDALARIVRINAKYAGEHQARPALRLQSHRTLLLFYPCQTLRWTSSCRCTPVRHVDLLSVSVA